MSMESVYLETSFISYLVARPSGDLLVAAHQKTTQDWWADQAILASGALPLSAGRDAAHVAVAAFHAVDYLLTWNCKHLANAQIQRKIAVVCEKLGRKMPIICTAEELMGD